MRKIFFVPGLCFLATLLVLAARADTVTLTDGSSFTGDVLKTDGSGLMLRLADNSYTNLAWSRFSQDSLKQFAQNPKAADFVSPFIDPSPSTLSQKEDIKINPVARLDLPAKPSVLFGLLTSPVGLFVLLLVYAANLFAAFEIAVIKSRPYGQVIGVSAVAPLIGPIIFLWMPVYTYKPADDAPMEAVTAPAGTVGDPQEEVVVVETAWKAEEKKPEPQIFARGKFTFNKRFVETKFAGFFGEAKGDAKSFSMEVTTSKGKFAVERIMQVSPTEVIFETVQPGQVTVLLLDIQEIKLNPKPTPPTA